MSGTVKSVFQGLAGLALAVGMLFVFVLLGVAFFQGMTWFSAAVLPWAFTASMWSFGISVLVLLPLAIFRATRGWSRKLPHPVDRSKVDFPGPRRCPCESPDSPRARSSAS
jgi:hypothetical protein